MKAIKDAIRRVVSVPAGQVAAAAAVRPESAYRFFFISGHPRSGTNWLSNLCNLHPDVCCHGEFHFQVLYEAFDRFTGKPWYVGSEPHVKSVAERGLAETTRKCLIAMASVRKPGASVVGDHTPKPFQLLCPDAAYLTIVRDGRDVIVSWTYHLLRTARPDIVHEQTRTLFKNELAPVVAGGKSPELIASAAKNLLRDREWVSRLASGWAMQIQNDLPKIRELESSPRSGTRVLLLKYEEMLGDLERRRAEVYRFLGVDPSRAAAPSRETHTIAGFGRDDPASFYRKGEAGDWKNYFDSENAGWFKACAGKELIDAGYERDDGW
jgi:hypothetical protein